ncbi:uncharacterized protein LOC115878065 [Sitophilus oryzae]|uniref:Uncharacterized protein LOC115878065 n=1 Tax=Sitophilus oryzae TaxID=7048 RepID=A0A6J2XFZ7_SITOR|nr:uncharacterized protein LOC115878065 [Sitophilus oryzae]
MYPPLSSGRQTLSADALNSIDDNSPTTNFWSNSDQKKSTDTNKEMPEFIQKEMDKRLGNRGKDMNMTPRGRPSSWDDKPNGPKIVRIKSSKSDDSSGSRNKEPTKQNSLQSELGESSQERRFSMAKAKEMDKDGVFGSAITLTDEEDL